MTYALGIDLGTTFTAAAVARSDGSIRVVDLGNHAAAIPSLVFLREDDTVLVGDAAARRGVGEPQRLAREFKRRVGDDVPIMLGRTPYSAERLMGHLLGHVVAAIADREGGPASAVAVSHPANWGPFKVDLLRQAVDTVGLPNARFVTEPIAAAIQYASTERVEVGRVIGVYDLGGGTFDAAVLRKTDAGFETLGEPQGIERLGGIDFDEAVFRHVLDAIGGIDNLDLGDASVRSALAHLRAECVGAKEALSADADATVAVLLPGVNTQVRITRAEFEDMVRPALRETVDAVRRALAAASTAADAVDVVLLAGGSSRIPLIAELLRTELGRPVAVDSHPKLAVALGAARLAAGTVFDLPATVPAAPSPDVPTGAAPLVVPLDVPAAPAAAAPPVTAAAMVLPGPEPTTAQRPPVAAGVTPPRPRIREASASVAVPAPARRRAVVVGAVAALVVAGGSAALAFGGGSGDAADGATTSVAASLATTPPTGSVVSPTTVVLPPPPPPPGYAPTNTTPRTTAPSRSCASASGRCVAFTTVELTHVQLLIGFSWSGFDHDGVPSVRLTLTDTHGARTTFDNEPNDDHFHVNVRDDVTWRRACLALIAEHGGVEHGTEVCRDVPPPVMTVQTDPPSSSTTSTTDGPASAASVPASDP